MTITNVRIKEVNFGFNAEKKLVVEMSFVGHRSCHDWSIDIASPLGPNRLMRLMEFAGVADLDKLEGKLIRIAESGGKLIGFGDPIEDRFILCFDDDDDDLRSYTEKQLGELMKKS